MIHLQCPDAETEERLLETVRAAAGAPVLLITHRIKTCRRRTASSVVADGCIVADGTHQQLLAQGGSIVNCMSTNVLRESLGRECGFLTPETMFWAPRMISCRTPKTRYWVVSTTAA